MPQGSGLRGLLGRVVAVGGVRPCLESSATAAWQFTHRDCATWMCMDGETTKAPREDSKGGGWQGQTHYCSLFISFCYLFVFSPTCVSVSPFIYPCTCASSILTLTLARGERGQDVSGTRLPQL